MSGPLKPVLVDVDVEIEFLIGQLMKYINKNNYLGFSRFSENPNEFRYCATELGKAIFMTKDRTRKFFLPMSVDRHV